MTITIETLWKFMLEVYARPGVEQACLDAQDAHGADVTLMLMLLYLDRNNAGVTEAAWQALLATSHRWQAETLAPLRARRRAAKGTNGYEALKAEELKAERAAAEALLGCLYGNLSATGAGLLRRYSREKDIPDRLIGNLQGA